MLAEQFERISRVSCVVPLAQQQARPLHSLRGAAPTAKEAPCPQHGVITSEISNPFLFVIVNLKIFCLFSLGNSPSRSPGLGVSLFTVQEHSPGDPQQAGCREGTAFADPLSPPPGSLHPLSHAGMLSSGCGCLPVLCRQQEEPAWTGVQWDCSTVRNDAENTEWGANCVWVQEPACHSPSHHPDRVVTTQAHRDAIKTWRSLLLLVALVPRQPPPACIPPMVRFPFAGRGINFLYSLTSAECTEPCVFSPHSGHCTNTKALCVSKSSCSLLGQHRLLWIPVSIQQHCDMLQYGDTNTPKMQLVPAQLPREPALPEPQVPVQQVSSIPAALLLQGMMLRARPRCCRVSKATTKDPFQLKHFFRKRAGLGDLSPTAGQFSLMLWTVCTYQSQTASSILFSSAPFCPFPILCLGLASVY